MSGRCRGWLGVQKSLFLSRFQPPLKTAGALNITSRNGRPCSSTTRCQRCNTEYCIMHMQSPQLDHCSRKPWLIKAASDGTSPASVSSPTTVEPYRGFLGPVVPGPPFLDFRDESKGQNRAERSSSFCLLAPHATWHALQKLVLARHHRRMEM